MRIITLSSVILVILIFSVITANIYAQEDNNSSMVKTLYFQVDVPDNWVYREFSDAYHVDASGFGVVTQTLAIPIENLGSNTSFVMAQFRQDADYLLRNAPLDLYVKYKLSHWNATISKVITEKDVTLANEPSRQIYGEGIGEEEGFKFLQYYLFHNKEPYIIGYKASANLYEKYLPDFERMVKSFKWIN